MQGEDLRSWQKKGSIFVGKSGVVALHWQNDQIEQWRCVCWGSQSKKLTVLHGWGPPGEAEMKQGGQLQE